MDLIQEGYNGLLLDVDSFVEDLPNAVDALLNPDVHAELRDNARASISSKTWTALCEQLVGYYEEVLEDTRRVPLTILGQRPELPRWAARALGARVA